MDGYVRVSRRLGRAGPGYISPKVQRDAIQRWADYRGVEIAAWHVDEDESGGTQARPGLREAMRRIEAGETDGLACWRLNRFARNVSGAIGDVKRIHAAGAHLACVEEDIDPTGPFGTFILTVLLAVATLERDNAVAGFEEAKRRAVERGAYISRTPYGYRRQADGTLAPHPEQGPVVSEAFRLAAGDSLQAAARHLRRVAPGARNWAMHRVRRMLAGRVYLGETRSGQFVKADTHEPLVSRAIWEAAQSTPLRRDPSATFPLSGIAQCGTCGSAMVGGRGGKGQRVYRCRSVGVCSHGAVITASLLEEHVREHARRLLAGLKATVSDPELDTLTVLERTIGDAEAELDAFAGDMTLRRALADRYHDHLQTRVDAVERARAAYREQARVAQTKLVLSGPDVVDDETLLPLLLRSMFGSIVVTPGRGMTVGERVRFLPLDGDSATGEPDS
jgi:DNA invertase Pin-like site-specific DNA recombinase